MYLLNPLLSLLLISLPSILSSPLPTPLLTSRGTCVNPELTPFYIQNFQLFTGPFTSSISFNYINEASGIMTTCWRLLSGDGISAAGISVADVTQWRQCDNVVVAFNWDGTRLIIQHGWSCDGITGVAGGHFNVQMFCFPVLPPFPLGEGTLCETPTGSALGVLTNNWQDTGRMTYQVDGDGNPMP